MKELQSYEQLSERIGLEFDQQKKLADPFKLISKTFADFKKGPLLLALGAVGGGGAGEKARGILEQFQIANIPFGIVAMQSYLKNNPQISKYLEQNGIMPFVLNDNVSKQQLYINCLTVLTEIESSTEISGILSLGPRTYYPEAARRLNIPSMIIDGAVPDKWEEKTDESDVPITEYFTPAYLNSTYATTCAFTGWFPPKDKYPKQMDLKIIAQPFSDEKIEYLKYLRGLTPRQSREILLEKNTVKGLKEDGIIVVPTLDQVYLDPKALTVFGRFLTPEQLGQSYGFVTDLIASLYLIGEELGKNIYLYLKPGVIRNMLKPVLEEFASTGIKLIGPANGEMPNNDWLLLRKAGVTIGRSPLCVSTAEALGMGDYQITTDRPGVTSDGISYMTEAEALQTIDKEITRTLFPGESLYEAIIDVIQAKNLLTK